MQPSLTGLTICQPRIQRIFLEGCRITPADLRALSGRDSLRSLSLDQCIIEGAALLELHSVPNLQHLSLASAVLIQPLTLAHLANFPLALPVSPLAGVTLPWRTSAQRQPSSRSSFDIPRPANDRSCSSSGAGALLAHDAEALPTLECVSSSPPVCNLFSSLSCCGDSRAPPDWALARAPAAPALRSLDLSGAVAPGAALCAILSAQTALQRLSLARCPALDAATIGAACMLPHLRHLDITGAGRFGEADAGDTLLLTTLADALDGLSQAVAGRVAGVAGGADEHQLDGNVQPEWVLDASLHLAMDAELFELCERPATRTPLLQGAWKRLPERALTLSHAARPGLPVDATKPALMHALAAQFTLQPGEHPLAHFEVLGASVGPEAVRFLTSHAAGLRTLRIRPACGGGSAAVGAACVPPTLWRQLLDAIAPGRLETLALPLQPGFNDTVVRRLRSRGDRLRSLDISGCTAVTAEGLRDLRWLRLTGLRLDNMARTTCERGLRWLTSASWGIASTLAHLSIAANSISPDVLRELDHFLHLETLNFSDGRPALDRQGLSHAHGRGQALSSLAHLPRLRVVHMAGACSARLAEGVWAAFAAAGCRVVSLQPPRCCFSAPSSTAVAVNVAGGDA